MTTDEGITVAVRVKREEELLAECMPALINKSREGTVQTSSEQLDIGYSYQPIIGAVFKARCDEVSQPFDIVATVRNHSGQFNLKDPCRLALSSIILNASNDDHHVRSSKAFWVQGAQCKLGSASNSFGMIFYATFLQEICLLKCGVTMMTTRPQLTLEQWHVVPATGHMGVRIRRDPLCVSTTWTSKGVL